MDLYLSLLLITWISISGTKASTDTGEGSLVDYCVGETFAPQCDVDEVILITQAYYGRMRVGKCIPAEVGDIGCEENILHIIDQRCSGRRQCEMFVPDREMVVLQPCGHMMSYLSVCYECLPIISSSQERCEAGDILKITSPDNGNIASITTRESGCGGETSPWLIEAPRGQHIRLTLLDFATSGGLNQPAICLMYADIKDSGSQRRSTVCGAQGRRRIVHESMSNQLELQVVSRGVDRHFILQYQFVGCKAMDAIEGYKVSQESNKTTVECLANGEISFYYCNGTAWIGRMPNCSKQEDSAEEISNPEVESIAEIHPQVIETKIDDEGISEIQGEEVTTVDFSAITWGMVLILVGIVTAGMVACVLIISCVYLKRKSHGMSAPMIIPAPPSDTAYETCDFEISKRASTLYRDGYRTVPKM